MRYALGPGLAVLALIGSACGRLSAPGSSPAATQGGGALGSGTSSVHPAVGLVSALPDEDRLDVVWRVDGPVGGIPPIALFVSDTRATLFDGTPIPVDPGELRAEIPGLTTDTEYFVGLGVDEGGGAFLRAGPVIRARTRAPIYCDAGSSASSPDGTNPGSAFPNLQSAVIQAFLAGGGNIWIAGGSYPETSINLPSGVHLYGGFPPGFAGGERDPELHRTLLRGRLAATILNLVPGDEPHLVDGLRLEGLGVASLGLQVDAVELEAHDVQVRGCGLGAKLRTGGGDPVMEVEFLACDFTENLTEGVSVDGAFDLTAEACSFVGNAQEGFDAGSLLAPDGEQVSVVLRDCRFIGNGAEGADIDLAAPLAGGPTGGVFEIELEDCAFEANGASGFLVDLDFEAQPLWRAEVSVRGCEARSNGLHGGLLDLDAASTVLIHRLASSANRGAGLQIDSETRTGTVLVSASALTANNGPGLRLSVGNFGAAVSHCVFAGNRGGGVISEVVRSSVHSSVFHQQPNPSQGTAVRASTVLLDPPVPPFQNAPRHFTRVTEIEGATLRLEGVPPLAVGDLAEVLDDRVARGVSSISSAGVDISPETGALAVPCAVAFFAPSAPGVVEDYRLTPASAARGVGMAVPFGSPVDAGVFGGPLSGVPGVEDLTVEPAFVISDRTPAWNGTLGPMEDFVVDFTGGNPDSGTLAGAIFVALPGEQAVPVSATVSGARVTVFPPAGGWQDGAFLEFHRSLRSMDGRSLSVPVTFELRVASNG